MSFVVDNSTCLKVSIHEYPLQAFSQRKNNLKHNGNYFKQLSNLLHVTVHETSSRIEVFGLASIHKAKALSPRGLEILFCSIVSINVYIEMYTFQAFANSGWLYCRSMKCFRKACKQK